MMKSEQTNRPMPIQSLTTLILKRVVPNYQNVHSFQVRTHYGLLEGIVSIVMNAILFIIKLSIGLAFNCISLIADAIHTLSDSGTSLVIIIGFYYAKKPSDKEHPFGHGRMENVTALIVSILIIVTGVEFIRSAFESFYTEGIETIPWWAIAIIFVTVIFKELLAQFSLDLSKRINSKALEADFWHHRSDVIATILVLVAMIGTQFGIKFIDGIAGVAVSIIIIHSGIKLANDTISPLLGESADPMIVQAIINFGLAEPKVNGVHDVIVHSYGFYSMVTLHIEVDHTLSLYDAHRLAESLEDKIEKDLNIEKATIHVDPINREFKDYPYQFRF